MKEATTEKCRGSRASFFSLPVDIRAQSLLQQISGGEKADNEISDAMLMDEIVNVIRDMLSVIRTGVDHGRIVCVGESKKKTRAEKKTERREHRKKSKKLNTEDCTSISDVI